MMAITTNNSIKVKAPLRASPRSDEFLFEVLIAKLTVADQGCGTTHPQAAALSRTATWRRTSGHKRGCPNFAPKGCSLLEY